MLPRIQYLEWISERVDDVTHNLGSSDMGSPYEPVVPAGLRDLPDPPADRTLEELIADQYGPEITTDHLLVTTGATQANFITAATVLDESDPTVTVEKPGYEPLVASPDGLGAEVQRFPRHEADGYRLDPNVVGDALDPSVDLVTVTNRYNPSGRLTDRETLAGVSGVVADHDARLLVDEVYAPFVSEPHEGDGTAFGGVTAAGLDRTVISQSLDKFHGYGEFRIGWLIADPAFVDRAESVRFHIPSVASPSRALAKRALHNVETLNERSRERLATNHEMLRSFVAGRDDLDGEVRPDSTIAFLKHRSADGDAVVERALEADILVIPGRFFGDSDGFRVSVAREPQQVDAALDAFGTVLDDLAD